MTTPPMPEPHEIGDHIVERVQPHPEVVRLRAEVQALREELASPGSRWKRYRAERDAARADAERLKEKAEALAGALEFLRDNTSVNPYQIAFINESLEWYQEGK